MYEWGYYTLLSDHHMCELGGQENCDFSKTYFNILSLLPPSGATKNSLIADVDGDHILLSFEGYAWYMSLAPLLDDCTAQRWWPAVISWSVLRGSPSSRRCICFKNRTRSPNANPSSQPYPVYIHSSRLGRPCLAEMQQQSRRQHYRADTMDQATPSVATPSTAVFFFFFLCILPQCDLSQRKINNYPPWLMAGAAL